MKAERCHVHYFNVFCRVGIMCQDFECKVDKKEPWYGTKYKMETIDNDLLEVCCWKYNFYLTWPRITISSFHPLLCMHITINLAVSVIILIVVRNTHILYVLIFFTALENHNAMRATADAKTKWIPSYWFWLVP
jgi:hypothetical protein